MMLLRRDKKSRTEDTAAANAGEQAATLPSNPPAPENPDQLRRDQLPELAEDPRALGL